MHAFLLRLKIAGTYQNYPRVFETEEAAEKAARRMIRRGAAEDAEIIAVVSRTIVGPTSMVAR